MIIDALFFYKILQFFDVIRDALLAEVAAAVGSDEEVVLEADSAKVEVLFHLVEVDELGIVFAGTPVVEQGGNEVDAGLIGHHKALLHPTAAAQEVRSELIQIGAHFIVEAHIDLPEAFHIVHVHAHHVAKAVDKEHGMSAVDQRVLGVAFHEADVLQVLRDHAGSLEVAIPPFHAGRSHLRHAVVGFDDSLIDIALLLCEASADRCHTRIVGTIVLIRLGSAVAEHQAAGLQGTGRGITMLNLAVHRKGGLEAGHATLCLGDTGQCAGNLLLGDTWAAHTHSRGVHLIADGTGALDFCDFTGGVHGALSNHCLDERQAGLGSLVAGMDTTDENKLLDIRRTVGMVFQNPDNQIVASVVEDDVAFAPENLGVPSEEIRSRVDEALRSVGMYEFRLHAPHLLSGGQKQRVAIAGILAMMPDCLVLDEPTAMLDPVGRKEVLGTVEQLRRERGITVILITHHMNECINADRLLVMSAGHIIADGTPKEVFSHVEEMKAASLTVPETTELIYGLRQAGYDVPLEALTVDECADAIAAALGAE